ncbi:MAG: TonB-dependent receptor [Acidobacteria bacterium]|nr:TonB-dependent receptor [Acidobacteriota bacterium]
MKNLAIIFVIILASLSAAAQQTAVLRGRVLDKGTGVAATLTLKASDGRFVAETESDPAGNYQFTGLKAGAYNLTARAKESGRELAAAAENIILTGGQNSELDLTLARIDPINETVTIAVGENQTVERVAKTVDVISGSEMRERADFTLIDSLRSIPGFRVTQSGGFGRLAAIKTRGLRNGDTAVLLDGIRFRDVTGINGDATPFLSDLTLTSVSRIEVLRGSGSSLYGTNAIGGTIDLQTPQARQGTHGQISGAAGGMGLGRFRGNLSHGTRDGRFEFTSGVSRTVYAKGVDGDDRAANVNTQARVDISPASRTAISGRIFFSDANVRLNSEPDTLGVMPSANSVIINAAAGGNFTPDVDDPDKWQTSRAFAGQLAVDQVITGKLTLHGYYQGLSTKRKNVNGPLGAGYQPFGVTETSLFDGSVHTANVHLTWTPARMNTLTAGYEFEREAFGNEGRTTAGTQDFSTNAGQRSNTVYVQHLAGMLGGNLQLAGGVRFQSFSLMQPRFSLSNAPYSGITLSDPPSAVTLDGAASYYISASGTKLRAHIGNGYRVPSLYERFGAFFNTYPGNSFIALGDPFLKPEKTIAVDAGIDQDISRGRVRLSATYFWTRLRDIIGYGNVVPNIGTTVRPFGGYLNQKGGRSQGGEFSIKAKPTLTTDLFASYTFTDSVQLVPQVTGSGILSTLGVPDHQFTLVATQRFRRFWVNFDLLATSDYLTPIFSNSTFSTYVYRFKGNRKGDLTAGYTFRLGREDLSLRVYGTVENVFNTTYYENGFRTPKATGRLGMAFAF